MAGVTYALADFRTGSPIVDLNVMPGAKWDAQLNRSDALSCKIDLNDAENRALDLRAASSPGKAVLLARSEDDYVLAWGIVNDDREWDEDNQTVSLSATGVWDGYFGSTIIGPATALSLPLTIKGVPNTALDTYVVGYSLGTIGKKLVQQRLTWPGSPTFAFPADEVGTHEAVYPFADFKKVGPALTDLTNRENGPDFAFDAARAADGLTLEYSMRHGSEAKPDIGVDLGSWALGPATPIKGLKYADNGDEVSSAVWLAGGRSVGATLFSRRLNDSLVTSDGYAPRDYVDTSRSSVSRQSTLNSYANAAGDYALRPYRTAGFTLRVDPEARTELGRYRPGDTVTIDVGREHPWMEDLPIRITSMSGDEAGEFVKIGCIVL